MRREERDSVNRGCGSRKKGGVYLCCGLTDGPGLPIEAFFIDPVRKYEGECFRAPLIVPDPGRPGVNHLAIWVGAEFYPTPVDYIEETRRLGASRRIPQDFDVTQLTAGVSRMLLIHPKAYTEELFVPPSCPMGIEGHGTNEPCIGAHWHYVEALGAKKEDGRFKIGQCAYAGAEQVAVDPKAFSPGMFLQLPISHIEYEAHTQQDTGPVDLAKRLEERGIEYIIVDSDA